MISQLSGTLAAHGDGFIVLDVGGVGYHVLLPQIVEKALSGTLEGESLQLETVYYLQIDQNRATPTLIGFQNKVEREFFERLLTVPKVGPRAALGMFSRPVSTIATAIETANHALLQTLSGVGKQKARDLVATLQGKVARFALMQDADLDKRAAAPAAASGVTDEAVQLLAMLGYKRSEAERKVYEAAAAEPNAEDAEALVRIIFKRQQDEK